MIDPQELVVIDVEGLKTDKYTHEEFLSRELDFDSTFDDYGEYRDFMISLGLAYPEGIPFEYFFQKLNAYRGHKTVNSLLAKGIIEVTGEDEDGDTLYGLTELGKRIQAS